MAHPGRAYEDGGPAHRAARAPGDRDPARARSRSPGEGGICFPSLRTRDRPMSENTINAALRRMGYSSEEQTGHGFRSMASTLLNEQGFPPDVIELQLAHASATRCGRRTTRHSGFRSGAR